MQITSGERVEIVGLITRTPLFELLQPVPMRQDRSIGQFVPTTVEVHFRGCTQVDWFEVVCHWCHRAPQIAVILNRRMMACATQISVANGVAGSACSLPGPIHSVHDS